jgi:hypothetical protein
MKHKWKENELNFLKENYIIYGANYCAEKLNIEISKIKSRVSKMKLKLIDKTDVTLFQNITIKEVVYILGFLWADGNIENNHNNYSINLACDLDDMLNIENIIMKTGNWNKYLVKGRLRNGTICKNSILYRIGFKKLYNIFKEYNYDIKSTISPYKILSFIPENIKHYFYLGVIDGDGCFYMNKKQYTYQFALSSTYNQDWSYMIELCEKLNISKYRIDCNKNEKSKYSSFRICRRNDIKILGEYIYQNYYLDQIGLKRKNDKYIQML